MYLTRLKMIAVLTVSLSLLSSCALMTKPPREVEIKTVPIKINITQPVLPRPIDMKDPQWYVVSEKNLDEFLERIKKESGGQLVFFAMSPGDYELMAFNLQEIKRYVKELKEVVVYYKTVTTTEDNNNGGSESKNP